MGEFVQIRAAGLTDCERLAVMFHALWRAGSVEEHGKEVRAILDGTAKLTMPIAVLVAETDASETIDVPGYTLLDERDYGETRLRFLTPAE